MNNTSINITGIKCDSCDFKDEDVQVEDYSLWLNRPCPKCNHNLLTQEDYDLVQRLLKVDIAPKSEDELNLEFSVSFNGTGKIKVSEPTIIINENNTNF